MPLVLIQHKADRRLKDLAENLAKALPDIVAPALTVAGRDKHLDGLVTSDDVEIWCTEGSAADVNTKDLEIIIWAHDFPARKKSLEERKEFILKGVRAFLADYDRNVSGFVWILLQPTAFGTI